MLKKVFIFICLIINTLSAIDPFSNVKITSNRAICQKSKKNVHEFKFNYLEDVKVLLADGSKITSESLEVTLNTKADTNDVSSKKNSMSHIKQIIFKKNVRISNQNRHVQSDSAVINLLDNTCLLEGNVKIKQTKVEQNDIPVDVQSTQALINFKTSQIDLLGSSQEPVSTVIELNKNVMPSKKKQQKNEQNKSFTS